jgi:predicted nucleic acid-binding protein
MAFPAFLDTCVLYSSTLTDTLLRIAEEDAFRPLWSAGVLDELRTVLEREAGLTAERAARRIAHMRKAFPNACDSKDRHVLAAAVAGGAQVLVTFNVADFPPTSVAAYDVTVVTPDAFLLDQLDLHPARVGRALMRQTTEAKRPPLSMGQLLGRLTRAGVPTFAEEARRHELGNRTAPSTAI